MGVKVRRLAGRGDDRQGTDAGEEGDGRQGTEAGMEGGCPSWYGSWRRAILNYFQMFG